jgi:hypothetical protein
MWMCAQIDTLPPFVDGQGGFNMVRFDDNSFLPYVGYITIADAVPDPPLAVLVSRSICFFDRT